jgi:predicted nucleotidyltransferase
MVAVTEDVLQDIVDRLVRCSDPRRIILFGSRARGRAGPESDVDLLVVEDEPFDPGDPGRNRLARWRRLHESLRGCRVPVDLLLFTAAEVEYWKDSINHVVYDALTEGRVIHERP